MAVSERDRRHFERIAIAKRDEWEQRARAAAAEPALKKIIEGLELGMAEPSDPARERAYEVRTSGKAELHARARRLGLIR